MQTEANWSNLKYSRDPAADGGIMIGQIMGCAVQFFEAYDQEKLSYISVR